MTTISDQDSLDGAMADDNMTKFGVDAGAFSYHMTMKNLRKAVDYPIVQPTGVEATDTQALINAYNALPASGGTIWIDDGELVLGNSGSGNNFYTFTKPVMLRGRRGRTAIIHNVNDYQLYQGSSSLTTELSAGVAFSGINSGESVLQSPNLSLVAGDWVLVWSEDAITTVDPHHSGGATYPGEIHRVVRLDGSDVILAEPVRDTMTTSPKIAKMTMTRNCGLIDVTLKASGVTYSNYAQYIFRRCHGLRVENVMSSNAGAGGITLQGCVQGTVSNYSSEYQIAPNSTYGLVMAVCNDVVFQDSTWNECRHPITTGAIEVGTSRYGHVINGRVVNITCRAGGDASENAYVLFDTHAEGIGMVFDSCRAFSGSAQSVICFQSRARETVFRNCEAHGNYATSLLTVGFRDRGTAMTVERGFAKNCWIGAHKSVGLRLGEHSDFTVDGTDFDNCATAAVFVDTGDNATIKNITTSRSGWLNNGSPAVPKTLIQIDQGTGHKIYNCQLNKQSKDGASNDYSIAAYNGAPSGVWHEHIDFDFNFCRGYGANKLGVRGAIGDPNGVSVTEAESFNSEFISSDHSNRYDLT